ncbi:MAG: SBBP repeat-containing protein [Sedimentisphaerales bacterium]|nr:SBBP repeat-containing protein [Sedimentisphaerales bacterium]
MRVTYTDTGFILNWSESFRKKTTLKTRKKDYNRAVAFHELEGSRIYISFPGANPVKCKEVKSFFDPDCCKLGPYQHKGCNLDTVAYRGLYEGIDLYIESGSSFLKYEFQVHPGANYQEIRIKVDGADQLYMDDMGRMHIRTAQGELIDQKPYIYQDIKGVRRLVRGGYKLLNDQIFGFEITGEYDLNAVLIIDPELIWSDFLGGSDYDYATAITTDETGNVYLTGETRNTNNFEGAINQNHGGRDAFVACMSPEGELRWMRYLGGSGNDYGFDIAVQNELIAVAGITSSGDLSGATNLYKGGFSDAFAAVLNTEGQLQWSAFLGGGDTDQGFGLTFDNAGRIVVTGYSESNDMQGAGNAYFGGAFDGFVAILTPSGSLQWLMYVGGQYSDYCEAVAVDSLNNIYVTGTTYLSDLPGSNNISFGGDDAFIVSLDSASNIRWSTYLGGISGDRGYGMAVTELDVVVVAGYTESDDFDGAINSNHGGSDVFVAATDTDGSFLWARYVGGSSDDKMYGLTVDPFGNPVVAGTTNSDDLEAADNEYNDGQEAFVSALTARGTLLVSSYIGGGYDDLGFDVSTDPSNHLLVTGSTSSADLPAALGSFHGGIRDAFVVKTEGIMTGLPELVIATTPAILEGYAGHQLNVSVGIENAGTVSALAGGPGYFRTGLFLANDEETEWSIDSRRVGGFALSMLDAQQRHNGTISFIAPSQPGTYYLRPFVDDLDMVYEQYEHNNWGRIIPLNIVPEPLPPDLIVVNTEINKPSYLTDEPIDVSIAVRNAGELEAVMAGSSIHVSLYLSDDPNQIWDDLIQEIDLIELDRIAGETSRFEEIQITAPQEPGRYYLRARVDASDVISEGDEDNNWGTILPLDIIAQPAAPDLQIIGTELPLLYSPKQVIQLLVDVQNIGDANAIGTDGEPFDVTVYLANHEQAPWDTLQSVLGQIWIDYLMTEEILFRQEVQIIVPHEPGNYYLRARADVENRIAERDEQNNWGPIIPFVVAAENRYPDLIAVWPQEEEIHARPGETVAVEVEVQNRGNEPAIPRPVNYFDTHLFLAEEGTMDWDFLLDSIASFTLHFLEPNEISSRFVSFVAPGQRGTYLLRAKTDVVNSVEESNEDNWSSARILVVSGMPVSNRPPVLDPIGDYSVRENQRLTIVVHATDPNDDPILYSASPIPRRAQFQDNTFTWIPDYEQAGSYEIAFSASDGELFDLEMITITVLNTNRPPQIYEIANHTVFENETVSFMVSGSDPDGDQLIYFAENLPDGALFEEQLFSWTPRFDQAGEYVIGFGADDGQEENHQGIETVIITVNNQNRTPSADAGEDQTIADSDDNGVEQIWLDASASTDPDEDIVNYAWSDNLGDVIPAGTDPRIPVLLRVGVHTVILTVTDAKGATSTDIVQITVYPAGNQPPQADAGPDQILTDQDGDGTEMVDLNGSGSLDPDGILGTYVWELEGQLIGSGERPQVVLPVGTHSIVLRVIDNVFAWAEDTVTITIIDGGTGEHAPVFTEVRDHQIQENRLLTFGIVAVDPDGDELTYSLASSLPQGASFDPITGIFHWRPGYHQAGTYDVVVTASDDEHETEETFTILVQDVPLSPWYQRWLERQNLLGPPFFESITIHQINEGQMLDLVLGPADSGVMYSLEQGPTGVLVVENRLVWHPTFEQAGVHQVVIRADLAERWDSQTFQITVIDMPLSDLVRNWTRGLLWF